jgi:galactokinase
VPARRLTAFAPGRVNVIGEHTDYNEGLALPFAIDEGVTVKAVVAEDPRADGGPIEAIALDLQESDVFPLIGPSPASGWRGFVRGAAAELAAAGYRLAPGRLEISGEVPRGAGLSSSAALAVSVSLALIAMGLDDDTEVSIDRLALAQLCSRVENDWTGANTGLLDQIASLFGATDTALFIDFHDLGVREIPLALEGWRFVVADSGERHVHASSGYNERRAECVQACELLGVRSLRQAQPEQLELLPGALRHRVQHVLAENQRVLETVAALQAGEPQRIAELIGASHASLRDLFGVSTPTVEAAVQRMLRAGAAGARLIGGGFGGSVLGLFAPGSRLPPGSIEVRPGPGAHVIGP